MTITIRLPFRPHTAIKSDISYAIVRLYQAFLMPSSSVNPATLTVRKSLLEPGTYIVDPGSFCLRPVKELLEARKRKKAIEKLRKKVKRNAKV